jgi:hypothetical protein
VNIGIHSTLGYFTIPHVIYASLNNRVCKYILIKNCNSPIHLSNIE